MLEVIWKIMYVLSHHSLREEFRADGQPGGEGLLLSHCVAPLPTFDLEGGSDSDSSTLVDSGYSSASSSSSPQKRLNTINTRGSRGEVEKDESIQLRDATRSFFGGMNNHSGAAREMMRCLRVAKLPTPTSTAEEVK
jgi:stearoyl-CoA desaturase (delta-9 desaturase)